MQGFGGELCSALPRRRAGLQVCRASRARQCLESTVSSGSCPPGLSWILHPAGSLLRLRSSPRHPGQVRMATCNCRRRASCSLLKYRIYPIVDIKFAPPAGLWRYRLSTPRRRPEAAVTRICLGRSRISPQNHSCRKSSAARQPAPRHLPARPESALHRLTGGIFHCHPQISRPAARR